MTNFLWLAYGATYAAVVILCFFPIRGPREFEKALTVALSLPPLALIGVAKLDAISGTPNGAIAMAVALNLGLLFGTRLDPLRAVVHWGEESRPEATDEGRVEPAVKEDVRPRSAKLPLLVFILGAVCITIVRPEWVFGKL